MRESFHCLYFPRDFYLRLPPFFNVRRVASLHLHCSLLPLPSRTAHSPPFPPSLTLHALPSISPHRLPPRWNLIVFLTATLLPGEIPSFPGRRSQFYAPDLGGTMTMPPELRETKTMPPDLLGPVPGGYREPQPDQLLDPQRLCNVKGASVPGGPFELLVLVQEGLIGSGVDGQLRQGRRRGASDRGGHGLLGKQLEGDRVGRSEPTLPRQHPRRPLSSTNQAGTRPSELPSGRFRNPYALPRAHILTRTSSSPSSFPVVY
jgi:hypothetical protein